ncbi:MAG: type IV pilin N-terminal domain-containing protein [Candidatus Methanoperedens sp.]|nr:type IV pilin N-terminal domain-containing protein [Candidatus Methanoperedens sp.]
MYIKEQKEMKKEEAVSPVIGVILMVVITVIIAAVLAVFAFGVGGPAKVPAAKLKFEAINSTTVDTLTISNTGGDSLILSELTIYARLAPSGNETIPNQVMNNWSIPTTAYLAPGKSITGNINNNVNPGDIINVQIMHISTGQLIADTRVTVH